MDPYDLSEQSVEVSRVSPTNLPLATLPSEDDETPEVLVLFRESTVSRRGLGALLLGYLDTEDVPDTVEYTLLARDTGPRFRPYPY